MLHELEVMLKVSSYFWMGLLKYAPWREGGDPARNSRRCQNHRHNLCCRFTFCVSEYSIRLAGKCSFFGKSLVKIIKRCREKFDSSKEKIIVGFRCSMLKISLDYPSPFPSLTGC